EWEGFRAEAYRCAAGRMTVGYGHTGADVTEGMTVTCEEADDLLRGDVENVERWLHRLTEQAGVRLGQCEWDAIVSLVFNIGCGNFERSTLWRKLRIGCDRREVAAEFDRWVYAGGRRLPGLVRRRAGEREWFVRR
ncbi:MAG: lysozyme, partial [Muribaculaceae bacterium]|nr:lysozyme [Muribaculaceae bacterium]